MSQESQPLPQPPLLDFVAIALVALVLYVVAEWPEEPEGQPLTKPPPYVDKRKVHLKTSTQRCDL